MHKEPLGIASTLPNWTQPSRLRGRTVLEIARVLNREHERLPLPSLHGTLLRAEKIFCYYSGDFSPAMTMGAIVAAATRRMAHNIRTLDPTEGGTVITTTMINPLAEVVAYLAWFS